MRRLHLMFRSCTMVACLLALAGPATAQGWSEKTTFTFDEPVEVPHATLPAGTYVFKLADTDNSRSIVEIWNESETDRISTTLAVPVIREDPADDVNVTFASTPEGMPPAVVAWFYPGQRDGNEFVYPTEQARHISETTKTLVLASDADTDDPQAWRIATFTTFDEHGNQQTWSASSRETPGRNRIARPGQTSGTQASRESDADRDQQSAGTLTEIDDSASATTDSVSTENGQSVSTDEGVSTTDANNNESDYTHRAPNVTAAPGEAVEGSGDVDLHGLEGEDLAEHHLEHARRLTDEILNAQGAGSTDHSKIEQIREHLDKAFTALDGESS